MSAGYARQQAPNDGDRPEVSERMHKVVERAWKFCVRERQLGEVGNV